MRCQRCGCQNAENDELCLRCGASLEVRAAAARPPGLDRTFENLKRDLAEIGSPGAGRGAAAPAWQPAQVRYGGFWLRFWACMLDGIVLSFILVLVSVTAIFIVQSISPDIDDPVKSLLIPQLVADVLVKACYFIYFHAVTGQTVGKLAFGLKVVKRDSDTIGFARAAVRFFGSFISMLCLGLGFVWIAFDGRRQGWHDKMAGSFVIRV